MAGGPSRDGSNGGRSDFRKPLEASFGDADLDRYDSGEAIARHDGVVILTTKDRQVRRNVVMKRLDQQLSPQNAKRERFIREARIQAQLEHPGIAPIYDVGIDCGENVYFTMQRASGTTLRSVLSDLAKGDPVAVKRWSREKLLAAFRRVCLTLHYAHERGVVHRNVTPDNIVLGNFGEVHVADWALAKVVERGQSSVDLLDADGACTGVGELIGTPGYAAPEQLVDPSSVDRRADVYSLGAILFELLCGERLHPGKTVTEILKSTHLGAQTKASIRAPSRRVPKQLDDACTKACALDPAVRYPTARELHDVVDAFLEADRDVAQRSELAARHAQRAEECAVRAIVSGDTGFAQRRTALIEIGRALALEPGNVQAQRALMALLGDSPSQMPAEAQKRYESEQVEVTQRLARYGVWIHLMFIGMLPMQIAMGVRRWPPLLLMFLLLLASGILCARLARQTKDVPVLHLSVFVLSTLAITLTAGFEGALVVVPPLMLMQTIGFNLGALSKYRMFVLAFAICGFLVAYALERFGITPPSYVFHDGFFTILPVIRDFPSAAVRLSLALVSVGVLFAVTGFTWKIHDAVDTVRHRLYVHSWQFAQLLPPEARSRLFAATGKLLTTGQRRGERA